MGHENLSPEVIAAVEALSKTLAEVFQQMIEDGRAVDEADAMAQWINGVFTEEQLEQMAITNVCQRGSKAGNLVRAIAQTQSRQEQK